MSDAPCMPLLHERAIHFDTRLCIGIDPVRERLPEILSNDPDPMLSFCMTIVDATVEYALAYKPNMAFFEADGAEGLDRLLALMAHIPDEIPVILDAKRGDIGPSSEQYARMAFDTFGADAVTVNPMMGRDSIQPFLDYEERGIFMLAATSNPGAAEFQSLKVEGESVSAHIARTASYWNESGNVGLVAGATRPEEIARLREIAPDLPFLIPGVGEQGGDAGEVMKSALNYLNEGVIVSISRAILYNRDPEFDRGAEQAARAFRNLLNDARQEALEIG
ncbi:orotidine-5'-phosphate decarboxylase [Gemmatimonadota bacterium]